MFKLNKQDLDTVFNELKDQTFDGTHLQVFYNSQSGELWSVLNSLGWRTNYHDEDVIGVASLSRAVSHNRLTNMVLESILKKGILDDYADDIKIVYECDIYLVDGKLDYVGEGQISKGVLVAKSRLGEVYLEGNAVDLLLEYV